MRRLSILSTFMTVVPLLVSGCHQAPATTGASALSPVGAGQAPPLNPFGGTTRVSPPPTGSYSAPNTYMGSPVPAGTVAPGQVSPMPQGPYPTQSNNAVGAGAQQGGWTTSNPAMAQPAPGSTAPGSTGVATVSTFGVSANDPRAGGMQVIDMTSAPLPPGYRPANAGTNISVPPPQGPAAYAPPAAPTQVYPTPSYPTNATPTSTYPTNGQGVSAPYPTNSSAQIASSLTPIPNGASAAPMNPATIQSFGAQPAGTVSGPSTEPVNSTTVQTESNLDWRVPGTQY